MRCWLGCDLSPKLQCDKGNKLLTLYLNSLTQHEHQGDYFACNAWLAPVNIRRRDSLLEELLVERLVKNVGVVIYSSFQSLS